MVRKASRNDLPQIASLIGDYVGQRQLLPWTKKELKQKMSHFWVINDQKTVLACAALIPYHQHLAEIRSLAVKKDQQKKGLGKKLIKEILKESQKLKIKKVFVFTYATLFFEKLGFRRVEKESLPEKYHRDCHACSHYSECNETALVYVNIN